MKIQKGALRARKDVPNLLLTRLQALNGFLQRGELRSRLMLFKTTIILN